MHPRARASSSFAPQARVAAAVQAALRGFARCGGRRARASAPGRRRGGWRRAATGPAVAALLVLSQAAASSQEVSPLRLKAYLIWNIAKHTKWPHEAIPPGAPFTVCVVGNPAVADVLKGTTKDQRVIDRSVVVRQSTADVQPPAECQVLFLSGISPRRVAQILDNVRDRPVLSISDIDGSAAAGVIVQFRYEASQPAYKVQLESAKRARLEIGAPVLRFAR